MASVEASYTLIHASAAQKVTKKVNMSAPFTLSSALKTEACSEMAIAAPAVHVHATPSLAVVSSNRSPAVRTETCPMFRSVSSKACLAPSQKVRSCTAT